MAQQKGPVEEKGFEQKGFVNWQEAFLGLMHNRDKRRNAGFVVFAQSPAGLAPFERACAGQTYNKVRTARYLATPGQLLMPLLNMFREDVSGTRRPRGHGDEGEPVGILIPDVRSLLWDGLKSATQRLGNELLSTPHAFFEALEKALATGDRVVLLCELEGAPDEAELGDLGFSSEIVDVLARVLPERVGLVFSGIPGHLDLSTLGEDQFLHLDIPEGLDDGKPPETSQPLRNDDPVGDDELQITSEVHALVDSVMAPEIKPPLVVGVLGGWGSGKSFVLHLLKERLRYIRLMDVSDPSAPAAAVYIGHPYLVHFDAWTYAKSNLWASLMQKVLFDLDGQLTLEQNLRTANVALEKGFDIWALIDDLTTERLEALGEELGHEALSQIGKWRGGETTGRTVWSELERLHAHELEYLKDTRKELALLRGQHGGTRLEEGARLEATEQALARRHADELAKQADEHHESRGTLESEIHLTRGRLQAAASARAEQAARREGWSAVRSKLSTLFGEAAVQAAPSQEDEVAHISETISALNGQLRSVTRYVKGLTPEGIVFLLIAVGGAALLALPQVQSSLADVMGVLGTVGGFLASIHASTQKYTSGLTEIQAEFDAKRTDSRAKNEEANAKALADDLAKEVAPLEQRLAGIRDAFDVRMEAERRRHAQELALQRTATQSAHERLTLDHRRAESDLEAKIETHRRRAGSVGHGKSLRDLVRNRVESGEYEKHLGLVHKVQEDLQELTDALMPLEGVDPELFPRGDPRIILVIDDLDRCPPKQVVEVLEAAQLLVKTQLFVVVLAMDVRYVTRALEKKYEGILVSDGEPSGLDYIEKIVQIPYRVRPITREAMEGYLRSQLTVRTEDEPEESDLADDQPLTRLPDAVISTPDLQRVNEALPPQVQTFTPTELEMIKDSALAVELSPRSTKRVVNVMKLVKNIWYRRGVTEPEMPAKRAIVLLLALSGGYPEVMRRLLLELERELRRPRRRPNVRLLTVLNRWVTDGLDHRVHAADWESVRLLIKDEALLPKEVTCDEVGLSNIELVRSFSFVGEVDRPPDPLVHNVGLDFKGPLSIDAPTDPAAG